MKRISNFPTPSSGGVHAWRAGWLGLLLAGVAVLSGCSAFERDWRKAVSQLPDQPVDPAGAFEGIWRSDTNGHTGRLRCLVGPGAPTARAVTRPVSFRYHAHWGMLSGTFETRQSVERSREGGWVSKGHWDLPSWAGGRYDFDIQLTGAGFRGRYQGGGDRGSFEMARPADR